jgi:hypothetical protein
LLLDAYLLASWWLVSSSAIGHRRICVFWLSLVFTCCLLQILQIGFIMSVVLSLRSPVNPIASQ